jgi:phage repressor protein C with HTH and peptisase S24 domain
MSAKKKTAKKTMKPKKSARKHTTPTKAKKSPIKKVTKTKPAPKRTEKKRTEKKKVASAKPPRKNSERVREIAFRPERQEPGSGDQSGDLQGLSRSEAADSESVDELVEEGNAFEADVVAGVESADNADEKEVRTHEVPEDDVPGEYLDND